MFHVSHFPPSSKRLSPLLIILSNSHCLVLSNFLITITVLVEMAKIAAISNISAAAEDGVLDQDSVSEQLEEEEEEDNVSLSDLPVNLKKQDQTQYPNTKSEPTRGNIEAQDQEFDFGSSLRCSSFLADTKMCAADEVFFQGQILPLRLSVSSDAGFAGLTRRSPASSFGLRSNSCRSRISPNSSFSSNSGSTATTTTATTTTDIGSSSKPRSPRRPRNQFYTEPSPKAQIKIPNRRLEKAGSRRHNSSMWDFFRLGLVRTPDIELQDINKALRSNSRANKSSVSRNSSVSSTNSTHFIANYNNATSTGGVLKSEDPKRSKQSKQREQRFFGSIHGCKCSFETVASDNVIIKGKSSSSGRSSANHINESKTETEYSAAHAMLKEKVEVELKMMKNNKQKQKQKQKQAMSHHRTYEWLKQLSHANSPPPLPVDV